MKTIQRNIVDIKTPKRVVDLTTYKFKNKSKGFVAQEVKDLV